MYEQLSDPLLPRRQFLGRLVRHAVGATGVVLATLGLGMLGYHRLEGLSWIDSYLNAAMILGGMGPIAVLRTTEGKIFAGTYALFAGMIFLVVVGAAFAPVVHRAMHRFHLDDDET